MRVTWLRVGVRVGQGRGSVRQDREVLELGRGSVGHNTGTF